LHGRTGRAKTVSVTLQHQDDSGPATCVHCGALAVGPCARCRAPVCGDCCALTEGGANVYAICLGCERRGGSSLGRAWLTVVGWVLLPILVLVALLLALGLLFGSGTSR
jgi:hypothetical protein